MFDTIPMPFCWLSLANKLTANTMSGLVQFAKYIIAPIATKYGVLGPNISPPHHMV